MLGWLLFVLLVILSLALVAFYLRVQPPNVELKEGVLPPRVETSLPVIGSALAFMRDPVKTLQWAQNKYGNVFRLNLLVFDATFVLRAGLEGGGSLHARLDKFFYSDHQTEDLDYEKGAQFLRQVAYRFPSPKMQLPEKKWIFMHKVIQYVLSDEAVATQYFEKTKNVVNARMQRWIMESKVEISEKEKKEKEKTEKEKEKENSEKTKGKDKEDASNGFLNLSEKMNDLIMEINIRNFLGDEIYEIYGKQLSFAILELDKQSHSFWALFFCGLPKFLSSLNFPGSPKTVLQARAEISQIIRTELQKRRKNSKSHDNDNQQPNQGNLLDYLSECEVEVDDDLLVDIVASIFLNSHRNLANHLFWLIAHLHIRDHPDQTDDLTKLLREQRKLAEEEEAANESEKNPDTSSSSSSSSTTSLNAQLLNFGNLQKMQELALCLKEVSRLYFSVMLPPRHVNIPFKFEGYTVPHGALLCVSPIVAHLDSNIFPEAAYFVPRRFALQRSRAAGLTAYSPSSPYGMSHVQFGFGLHKCKGERYALMVMQTCAALLLCHVRFTFKEAVLPPPSFPWGFGTAGPSNELHVRIWEYDVRGDERLAGDASREYRWTPLMLPTTKDKVVQPN